MKLTNETYDILKNVSMILGYVAVFIASLSDIWGFPYAMQVSLTVSALGILLGSILQDSSKKYHAEDTEEVEE